MRDRFQRYLMILALGLLAVASFKTFAADQYSWNNQWFSSADAAYTAWHDAYTTSYPSYGPCVSMSPGTWSAWNTIVSGEQERGNIYTLDSGSCQSPSFEVYQYQCTTNWYWDNAAHNCTQTPPQVTGTDAQCQSEPATLNWTQPGQHSITGGKTYCIAAPDGTMCGYSVSTVVEYLPATDTTYASLNNLGKACQGTDPQPGGASSPDPQVPGDSPVQPISGNTNCGLFNGEKICLDPLPSSGCIQGASGGKVCAASAPTPPAPDNGTAGTKASPDASGTSVSNNNSKTWNYYNNSTVNGSSTQYTSCTQAGCYTVANQDAQQKTKIDESGTPTFDGTYQDGSGLDGYISNLGNAPGLPNQPSNGAMIVNGGGSCQPLPALTIMGVSTGTLDWCPAIDSLRGILKWFLWVATAAAVWFIWIRERGA